MQRRQDPHPAPAFARLLEQNLLLINYKCVLLGERLCARRRFPDRQGLRIHCSAKSFNWTRSASRPAPETNEGAQIDERGVVNARGALWNKRRRVLPEHFLSSYAINRTAKIKNTRQDTCAIGLDNRRWLVKRQTGDGMGCVFSNSWELLHFLDRSRKAFAVPLYDGHSGGVKISCTRVIPKPLPRVEHVVFASARE